MANHTEGPWEVSYGGDRILAKGDLPKGTGQFCPVAAIDPDNVLRADADAKLIAAAPDLLAALKETLRASPAGPHVKRAQAAIAKATAVTR